MSNNQYRNLKNIPTAKIVEILSTPYSTTGIGSDYGPVKEELEGILWERQGKEKAIFKEIPPALPVAEIDRTMLVCEIRESWKVMSVNGFSYFEVAIPPRLMGF